MLQTFRHWIEEMLPDIWKNFDFSLMMQKYTRTDLNFQSYNKQEQSQFRIKEQGEIAWYESFHRGKIKIQIKK